MKKSILYTNERKGERILVGDLNQQSRNPRVVRANGLKLTLGTWGENNWTDWISRC